MSHPLFNPGPSGNQQSTQIHNGPPATYLPKGFSNLGPVSSGSSSAALANYMPGQNKVKSDNNTVDSVAWTVKSVHEPMVQMANFSIGQRSEFPSSSSMLATSQRHTHSAGIDPTSLDWLAMYKQATKNDASEFSSLFSPSGFNVGQRVLSGEQVENSESILGLGDNENPVSNRSVFSTESNQLQHPTETAAEILQRFGLDEGDLKKLDSYSLNRITPGNLSRILQHIYIQKEQRAAAAGKSSKPHSQPRSILKPSKVIDFGHSEVVKTSSDDSNQMVDRSPLNKESTSALDSKRTSVIKPDSDPSERLQVKPREEDTKLLRPKVSKSCPLKEPESGHLLMSETQPSCSRVSGVLYSCSYLKSSNSESGKTQRKRTVVDKQRSKQQIKQNYVRQKTQVKLRKHRQNKPVTKTREALKLQSSSAKASSSKPPEVLTSVPKRLPTLAMIEDFEGATPRTFPHMCSLCDQIFSCIDDWLYHQSTRNHCENSRLLQRKYPKWIREVKPFPGKEKTLFATSRSSLHRLRSSKPESWSRSNGASRCQGLEGQSDESGNSSRSSYLWRHHSRRSRSPSHIPGSSRGLKKKTLSSGSRSCSSSRPDCVSKDEGEKRSNSPHSFRQTDPSVCPLESNHGKYTPESAAEILKMFGLDKEDIKELDSYPEDQITPENLHLVLRQIFLQKKKRATAAENLIEPQPNPSMTFSPDGTEMSFDKMSQSLLKPVKVVDYGHCAKYTIVGDEIKKTSTDSSEPCGDTLPLDNSNPSGCKKAPLQKCKKHVRTFGLDSKNRPSIKLGSGPNKRPQDKPKWKVTKPLKSPGSKNFPLKQSQSGQMSKPKIRKSSAHLTGGCPSGPNLNSTKHKCLGKRAAAAVKTSKLQMDQKPKRQRLKQRTLKHETKVESKTGKAPPCDISSGKLTPTKPPAVKGSVSNHLPTLEMIKDYAAATPRTFPHTCSICNKECSHMQDWLSHQNTSFHLESCRILRTQYPKWDGDVLPLLSAEIKTPSTSPFHWPSHSPHRYYGSEGRRSRSRTRSHSRSRSYSPASHCCPNGQWSRSRSRSNSHYHSGSKDRRERSTSRSRSPFDCRRTQRSRSGSPQYDKPSSTLCCSHSRSHERQSSSRRRDEKWFSPRRSCERKTSPRPKQERRLSTESSVPRSEKISSAERLVKNLL
ncbi:zinc finger protein 638-like isoform X2 [Girardinichthys multiradiatus]|uniref:zinc finger protein 638-like isoform X2 n=1 Tax=Girardinichthys multiradiatus TaxID=208333 RepID=UPI001FACBB11|nr:zinc finger protein 638-like isoform X2 [Girardinichthys multiradiatus]